MAISSSQRRDEVQRTIVEAEDELADLLHLEPKVKQSKSETKGEALMLVKQRIAELRMEESVLARQPEVASVSYS